MSKNTYRQIIPQLLGNTEKSYYRWKEEKRPIIALLESFLVEELEEFLKIGKISLLNDYREHFRSDNNATYKLFIKFLEFQSQAYNEVKESDVKRLEEENTSLKSELENLKQKLALFQKMVNEP